MGKSRNCFGCKELKVLVLTLGFDEKFAVRALLRAGLSFGDKALIFLAEPLDERAIKAWKTVEDIISRYFSGVTIEAIKINVADFYDSIKKISEKLRAEINENSQLIINLSGGMRVLILEVLIAAHIVGLRGEVEVEYENFMGLTRFPLEILKLELKDKDKLILRFLKSKKRASIVTMIEELGLSKSAAHRRIGKLARNKLVKVEKKGRSLICEITELANAFI